MLKPELQPPDSSSPNPEFIRENVDLQISPIIVENQMCWEFSISN
jgi:hypothetical protein